MILWECEMKTITKILIKKLKYDLKITQKPIDGRIWGPNNMGGKVRDDCFILGV